MLLTDEILRRSVTAAHHIQKGALMTWSLMRLLWLHFSQSRKVFYNHKNRSWRCLNSTNNVCHCVSGEILRPLLTLGEAGGKCPRAALWAKAMSNTNPCMRLVHTSFKLLHICSNLHQLLSVCVCVLVPNRNLKRPKPCGLRLTSGEIVVVI